MRRMSQATSRHLAAPPYPTAPSNSASARTRRPRDRTRARTRRRQLVSLTRRRGPTCQPNDPNLRLLDRPISLPSQVAQIAPNARLIAPLNKERAVTAGRAGVEVRARCAVAIDRTRHPLESRARPGAASAPAPAPAPLLPLEAQMSAPPSVPPRPPAPSAARITSFLLAPDRKGGGINCGVGWR